MLIPERSRKGVSAKAEDNLNEVSEAMSVDECNRFLREGWGLLVPIPKEHYDVDRGIIVSGIVYIMCRTVV